MQRQVKQLVSGIQTHDGAGVSLTRIIGQPALPRLDPFLMLDEFGSDQPQDYLAGFPPHPHRGFQTVTYMLAGKMAHADSVGNKGLIETGGVQWMNAGRGIIHEEMPQQTEGLLRGFQLWVNLPAAEKMSAPGYQDLAADKITEITVQPGIKARILAGRVFGAQGPVSTQAVSPLFVDIHAAQDAELTIPVDVGHNAFIYPYEGQIQITDTAVLKGQLAVLSDGEEVNIQVRAGARFILATGRPLNEPVVQYGPFVMNTHEEIQQAIRDYQSGRLA
ncbi:pirin family protein [Bowmanella yangjiangensis]|uniref:Pirin family protein n=1 Tax=Bowmanella yangjiangensis TaxID=2811230 RepID=A0ABS3CXE3_9ALTE|nr:pirin family protein [Bowmanella yangjiangensis]MBN7821794.1 pirin family protein [Bowmanella yangjiangensis]